MTEPIYILGGGSMGCLIAYELSLIKPEYDIVLLFRNEDKCKRFEKGGFKVTLHRAPENIDVSAQVKCSCPTRVVAAGEKISNLIVCTKTYQTESALEDYLPLIEPSSDILFVQNGMGVADILHTQIWPDVSTRPKLYQGVTNHGGFKTPNVDDEFMFTHAGYGDLKIAQIPDDLNDGSSESKLDAPMIQELLKPKILNTVLFQFADLLVVQIEKLMVNSCINPITSIVDCINGELNSLDGVEELFRSIIAEGIKVFFLVMPILSQNKSAKQILDVERLVLHVVNVGTIVNKLNSSSMHEDTLHLRTTEIDFINGYIVKLGEQAGLSTDVNKTITLLVKTRLALNRSRAV